MELLAPAGSFEAAKAAVNAGADAIYMGGPLFSARAYAKSSADGMEKEEAETPLMKALSYCHLHRVKVYMTVNTLMKEKELSGIEEYLRPYVEQGIDAFIVQDPGLMAHLKKVFPEVPLHVSTQAAVTGPRYARRLKELGAVRVVPARELSLKELRAIADTGIEVEAFIHGALCYSYSGQCLMSSMIGGRSGNRGRCAGPCRLPYEVLDENRRPIGGEDENYVLSMKDLNTLGRLSELEEAGVCSLKIEGRMKSPLYVAGVTGIYRKWLDKAPADRDEAEFAEDMRRLGEIFDRGGTTDGYLDGKNGRDMVQLTEKEELRVPDAKVVEEITEKYLDISGKIPVRVKAVLRKGTPASLTISEAGGGESVTVRGQEVQQAGNRPVTEDVIREKLFGFGTTELEPVEETIEAEEDIFVPSGELKALRRQAAEELYEAIRKSLRGNGGTV